MKAGPKKMIEALRFAIKRPPHPAVAMLVAPATPLGMSRQHVASEA
jgi:hypothetical protein